MVSLVLSEVTVRPTLRRISILLCTAATLRSSAQAPTRSLESIVPNRLVVVYRPGTLPSEANAIASLAGARSVVHLSRLGMSSLQLEPASPSALNLTAARLRSLPQVAAVLQDRYVTGQAILPIQTPQFASPSPLISNQPVAPLPVPRPQPRPIPTPNPDPVSSASPDAFYDSPQGWAVQQAGGFGDSVPGAASLGPWNITRGAGVRIAILDSGVDASHPDIAPNLALNLTEIVPSALPTPCDDGTPQDQQGHGTWVASLAAAAIGGGNTIGVAPQASILNIKVLERMPSATGSTLTAQCEAGQPGGLLSWVLQGIDDALAQNASVISLSLGTLVDLNTGDGAGWQSVFNAVTNSATSSGAVIVAALGNDGLNLSAIHYAELPAQSRGVLPVVASTNPACAENLAANAICTPGPITRASYSNFDASLGAIAAPGGSLPQGSDTGITGFVRGACTSGLPNTTEGLPTDPNHSFGCFALGHTAYVQAMGTSASAPLVAGAAALLHAARPDLTAAQIVATLRATAMQTPAMAEPLLDLPAALSLPATAQTAHPANR
jgi:hypothetical protein